MLEQGVGARVRVAVERRDVHARRGDFSARLDDAERSRAGESDARVQMTVGPRLGDARELDTGPAAVFEVKDRDLRRVFVAHELLDWLHLLHRRSRQLGRSLW